MDLVVFYSPEKETVTTLPSTMAIPPAVLRVPPSTLAA
jgi:hypothetical protein